LNEYELALKDLHQASDLCPDTIISKEIKKVKEMGKVYLELEKTTYQGMFH